MVLHISGWGEGEGGGGEVVFAAVGVEGPDMNVFVAGPLIGGAEAADVAEGEVDVGRGEGGSVEILERVGGQDDGGFVLGEDDAVGGGVAGEAEVAGALVGAGPGRGFVGDGDVWGGRCRRGPLRIDGEGPGAYEGVVGGEEVDVERAGGGCRDDDAVGVEIVGGGVGGDGDGDLRAADARDDAWQARAVAAGREQEVDDGVGGHDPEGRGEHGAGHHALRGGGEGGQADAGEGCCGEGGPEKEGEAHGGRVYG